MTRLNQNLTALIILVSVLVGCQSNQVQHKQLFQYANDNSKVITYSGVGAASVGLFMSSMGPSGAAIGIGIDVGIQKELNETLLSNDIDLLNALSLKSQNNVGRRAISKVIINSIKLSSRGDTLSAELHFELVKTNGAIEQKQTKSQLSFVEDLGSNDINDLKKSIEQLNRLINHLASHLLSVLLEDEI